MGMPQQDAVRREPVRQRWMVAGAAAATVAVVAQQTTRIFADDYRSFAVVLAGLCAGALMALVARTAWPLRVLVALVGVAGCGIAGVLVHDGTLPDDLLDAITSGVNQVVAAVWPSPTLPASTGAIAIAVGIASVVAVELAVRGAAAAARRPGGAAVGAGRPAADVVDLGLRRRRAARVPLAARGRPVPRGRQLGGGDRRRLGRTPPAPRRHRRRRSLRPT